MTKEYWAVIAIYALLALGFIILTQLPARCQKQFKIFKVDTTIQQTVFCWGKEMKTDSVARIAISFRGLGKKPDLMNVWVTHYPEGIPRRRHIHWKINP